MCRVVYFFSVVAVLRHCGLSIGVCSSVFCACRDLVFFVFADAVLIAAQYAHFVSVFSEVSYQVHCGNGGSVVFLAEYVANYGYFHLITSSDC